MHPAEHLPAQELAAIQLSRLRALLERARVNPFYAPKLQAVGQLDSLEDLRRIPLTRKPEMVADNRAAPPYGRRLQIPPDEVAHVVETSGTTLGGRETYAMSRDDEERIAELEARGFARAGVGRGSVVMKTLPMATTAASVWYYLGLKRLGANIFEIGTFPTERKVDYLERFGAQLLIGTPTYIQRLAIAARESGRDPRQLGVRAVLVAAEPFSVEWAEALQDTWGARLFEQYGSTQRAFAFTCERGAVPGHRHGMLHFFPDECVYEVLDPESGEPVGPYELGELVITPLVGEASPIIRFATGDRVRLLPPEACDCGRATGGIESGTTNRFDNMIKVRGINVWPEAVDELVFRFPEVAEYEAEVSIDPRTGQERVRLVVERRPAGGGDPQPLFTRLAEEIRRQIGIRVEVEDHVGQALLKRLDAAWQKRSRWRDVRRQGGGQPSQG